ncbi:hypothetical protein [Pedobacter jeongneungensis]|uniref:hypothetical protein n=1 Tax=Pedobacter jeongneungensis TaxID=947309 RepID=UPI000469460C|nr:hypothetical protein [Pedobacter jeongneungensis]
MQFTKISEGNTCNCLTDTIENNTDKFVRKVTKSPTLKDRDFRTHAERGKVAEDKNDCNEVCGKNALSFEIWNSQSSDLLMKKYLTTLALSPQSKNNLCLVSFKPNSGLTKYTPDQIEYNEFHYDFYKEDSFSIDSLELIEMIPLVIS